MEMQMIETDAPARLMSVEGMDMPDMDPDMPMPMPDDGDMPMPDMDMTMYMHFWHGKQLTWLIPGWDSSSSGQYAGGLIVCFVLGVLVEGLMYFRNYTYIKAQIHAIKRTEELNR